MFKIYWIVLLIIDEYQTTVYTFLHYDLVFFPSLGCVEFCPEYIFKCCEALTENVFRPLQQKNCQSKCKSK